MFVNFAYYKMEPAAGIEPAIQPYKGCSMPFTYAGEMERPARVALASSGWKPEVILLYEGRQLTGFFMMMELTGGIEPPTRLYESHIIPFNYASPSRPYRAPEVPALWDSLR